MSAYDQISEPLNRDIQNLASYVNNSSIGKLVSQGAQAVQDTGIDYAIPQVGLTKTVTSGILKGWLADLLNVGKVGKGLQLPNWGSDFLSELFNVTKGTKNLLGAKHARILESPIFNDVAFSGTIPSYSDAAALYVPKAANDVTPELLSRLGGKPGIVPVAGRARIPADLISDLSHEAGHFLTLGPPNATNSWGHKLHKMLVDEFPNWKKSGDALQGYSSNWVNSHNEAMARSVEEGVVNKLGVSPNRKWSALGMDESKNIQNPEFNNIIQELVNIITQK